MTVMFLIRLGMPLNPYNLETVEHPSPLEKKIEDIFCGLAISAQAH